MLTTDTFRRLCRARDLLRETHDHTVPIPQIAREAVMSPFHFIRQFSALFGETPHQWRIQARLDRARDLLALGDRSVTDICMEVGFSSLGSFSRLFTRRVGATPSAYRRRAAAQPPFPGCFGLMAQLPSSFREAPAAPACQGDPR